jgi:hypothetical protein
MIKIANKCELAESLFCSVDHALMLSCKHEIKTHCQEHTEPNGILNCLKVGAR